MRFAIALTLTFFAVVSAMGVHRDMIRALRDRRPSRYLGVFMAAAISLWCLFAAVWAAKH